jgi:hypothetical protein
VHVRLGPGADDGLELSPRSAFAEYLELPGQRNELRITLASYEASCERFIPPGPGQASVTVVIVTPPEQAASPGVYGWNGETAGSARLERAFAAPTVRVGAKSHVLAPGGAVELGRVELDLQGRVEGRLALEFSGDAERPATSVRGPFRARVCRSQRAAP